MEHTAAGSALPQGAPSSSRSSTQPKRPPRQTAHPAAVRKRPIRRARGGPTVAPQVAADTPAAAAARTRTWYGRGREDNRRNRSPAARARPSPASAAPAAPKTWRTPRSRKVRRTTASGAAASNAWRSVRAAPNWTVLTGWTSSWKAPAKPLVRSQVADTDPATSARDPAAQAVRSSTYRLETRRVAVAARAAAQAQVRTASTSTARGHPAGTPDEAVHSGPNAPATLRRRGAE